MWKNSKMLKGTIQMLSSLVDMSTNLNSVNKIQGTTTKANANGEEKFFGLTRPTTNLSQTVSKKNSTNY